MIVLLAVLIGLDTHATIYIVGDQFCNWDPAAGIPMTDNGDGTYSYMVNIDGIVYFVFADGLDSDWSTFNTNYRYGPVDGDQLVYVDEWVTTQKAGDNGAYRFQGSGDNYTFTFDEVNRQFRIEGFVDPLPPVTTYTVVGPEAVFGSNWNETDENNDMVKGNDGIYSWTKENVDLDEDVQFKIVGNHDWSNVWPQGYANNWTAHVEQPGIYTIVITFNPSNEEITCTLTPAEGPEPKPIFGDLNGDGSVNISDLTLLIDIIISGHTQ